MNTSKSPVSPLSLLKLGGSLITDKKHPTVPRPQVMLRLAQEIASARQKSPQLQLVIGHGAGSFAHVPAKKYNTRQGVQTAQEWRGFAEVWWQAAALNRLLMDALHEAQLPVIGLPPSAAITAQDGRVLRWDLYPIKSALSQGLIPVIFGDVIFDVGRGGTILSTEDLFDHLALHLKPQRILLAGIEPGVWSDYPRCTQLLDEITPTTFQKLAPNLSGSQAIDVTGGMEAKVKQSLELVSRVPDLEILIFSGETPGFIERALLGDKSGTLIHA